jgi:eukaryotic-like serine/threonine-protein kinase
MSDVIARLNAALEGRYRLESELGSGGMATVYLADDLRHERKVAVKVLRPELAAVVGADRFLSEIKTTANLQHPHILPLFDSGEADSFLFYVMPHIEGETLRERIDRDKQLPVDEALGIATAVANALQTAHEAGIVHRDIKPGNILLSRGEPLVADFGIALAVGAGGSNRLTETGLSIGTPYYMSPEQATGDQAVGTPSDTYALAAVLYEMLTGDPPYVGSTAQAVLGKIIQGVPVSATAVRKSIPANVDAALRKALEKLPADRFPEARGFARALADPSFRHGDADAAAVNPGPWKRLAVVSTGAALVLLGLQAWSALRPEPAQPVGRFAIASGDGTAFTGTATIMSDGTGMLYVAPGLSGQPMLWMRRWDEEAGTPIRGTEGASGTRPSVSPDGTEVVFSAGFPGPLRVAPLLGGAVRTIADNAYGGGVWSSDGQTIYYTDNDDNIGVSSVPAGGGQVTVLLDDDAWSQIPFWLIEDDDVVLYRRYVSGQGDTDTQVQALRLSTGELTTIVEGTSPIVVLPGGQLMYGTADGAIMAAPFDANALEITRAAAVMVEGVAVNANSHTISTVSRDGSLLYQPGASISELTPAWIERDGSMTLIDPDWKLIGEGGNVSMALSPDATRLAVSSLDAGWNVSVRELESGTTSRFTFEGSINRRMSWSPDGETVYFTSNRAGQTDLWSRPADGSRGAQLVFDASVPLQEAYPSPDGERLLLRLGANAAADVYGASLSGDTTVTAVAVSDFREWHPALSPDGRWVAYASNESGQDEVYVRPFPDAQTTRVLVSADGGSKPVWSRDGTELFYHGSSALMAASVVLEPTFAVSQRQVLFAINHYPGSAASRTYDVHPDGDRFVVFMQGSTVTLPTVYVQNWSEEVEARVGN